MSNVKILVTYKNENKLLKSDILTPIQTGRAIADRHFENMIGDDTGNNVSARNAKFSEISAQYWAWKNYIELGNPDYIGFMHYRRHFIFNDNNYDFDHLGCAHFPFISEDYCADVGLIDENIEKYVKGCDIIVPKELDLNGLFWINKPANPRTTLLAMGYIRKEHYDLFIKTIIEKAPEYSDVLDEFQSGTIQHCYNMFIMKNYLFKRYNEFLFPILFELERKIDSSMFGVNGTRFLGYFSELLMTIFVLKLKKERKHKINYLNVSFIDNSSSITLPLPLDNKDSIPIVLSSFDYEVELLATTLISIKNNNNELLDYNIFIIDKNISEINKLTLNKMFKDTNNISITFIRLDEIELFYKPILPNIDKTILEQYITFFIPRLFADASRIIYLNLGLLVNSDLKDLIQLDLKDNVIGACLDLTKITYYNSNFLKIRDLFDDDLLIKNPYKYFNSDMLVYNFDKWINNKIDLKLYFIIGNNKLVKTDEQAMNIVLANKTHYIDVCWNYQIESYNLKIQHPTLYGEIPSGYVDLLKHQKYIINYSSPYKPWFFTFENEAELWWDYFSKTPYYYLRLTRNNHQHSDNNNSTHKISNFRLYSYKILYKVLIGNKRKKIKEKYNFYRKIKLNQKS